MYQFKKQIAIITLLVFSFSLFSWPFLLSKQANAQEGAIEERALITTESECTEQGGAWDQTTETCYAQAPSVKLQIPIPGLSERVQSIGQYISAVYKFAIGAAAILATIMIMIGGFLWMTAGGSPERIKNAQGYIFGAVIGLLLAFGSYVLLQTINPKLVEVEPVKVPLLKAVEIEDICGEVDITGGSTTTGQPGATTDEEGGEIEFGEGEGLEFAGTTMKLWDICYTEQDKERCRAVCTGCECHQLKTSTIEKVGLAISEFSIAIMTLGVSEVGAQLSKAAVKEGWKIFSQGGKTFLKGSLKYIRAHKGGTAIAVVSSSILADAINTAVNPCAVRGEGDKVGFCYREANCEVGLNGFCSEDKHCKLSDTDECRKAGEAGDRKCVIVSDLGGGVKYGFCSDGSLASNCSQDSDCKQGLTCLETWPNLKQCSDFSLGAPCGEDSDCLAGAAKCGPDHVCISSSMEEGSEGYPCQGNPSICKSGLICQPESQANNALHYCITPETRQIDDACSQDSACISCVCENQDPETGQLTDCYKTECDIGNRTCVWQMDIFENRVSCN